MSSDRAKTIIYFPPSDLEKTAFSKVLCPLSEYDDIEKIIVVNRPADCIVDPLNGFKRLKRKIKGNSGNVKIKHFTPLVLLSEVVHESICSFGNVNMRMLIWQLKRLIKREGIESDELMLWSFSPYHWKIMRGVSARKKIYGVYDEWCYNHRDRFNKNAYIAENKMISYVDEIVCASVKLKEKFQQIAPKGKIIGHISTPADDKSFHKCNEKGYMPWDVIPDPKLVILGVIRQQTDLSLVEKLALSLPDVSIVFIGANRNKGFKRLVEICENVYHLGFLSSERVNHCLRESMVGLYPAKKRKYSAYANPNRIYEYAAAGIPVVAINMSYEPDFPKTIIIANDDEGFVEGVKHILKNKISDIEREELEMFAKKHSASEIAKSYIKICQI